MGSSEDFNQSRVHAVRFLLTTYLQAQYTYSAKSVNCHQIRIVIRVDELCGNEAAIFIASQLNFSYILNLLSAKLCSLWLELLVANRAAILV